MARTRRDGIEPSPVVDDVERQLPEPDVQPYGHAGGAAVFHHVVERFLRDPVQT